ncbi:MAG TPA: DUF3800 domain-containing protein [Caulobacteraceae bacterium]|jgi:hypothetical protein
MVRLEAYVDDSASDVADRRLFLAGYINSAERWTAFSQAWNAELAAPPAIAYFKMAEAQNLRDEFKGWSEADRDAKVLALARLIPEFRCWSAHASVSRSEYATLLAPASPAPLKTPYFCCWWMLIDTVARYHQSLDLGDVPPTHFTFDQQGGLGDDAALWYPWIKAAQTDIQAQIGERPVFRDDKLFPAIQAADMLAWHLRRRHERDEQRPAFDLLVGDSHVCRDIDAATLTTLARQFRRVPGVDLVQSRSEWRKVKAVARAAQAAGRGPPKANLLRMHMANFRVRISRFSTGIFRRSQRTQRP